MNAIRRSIRITRTDTNRWEISAVDTEFLPDGRQRRQLVGVRSATDATVRRIAHQLVSRHIEQQFEEAGEGSVEAAERE